MVRALLAIIALLMLLSACIPRVFLNRYNATDETLTITRAQFRPVITIPARFLRRISFSNTRGW
jgi:hypothetical protein